LDYLIQTFRDADPVVRVLGGLALAVGTLGPILTWITSGVRRDRRRLQQVLTSPDVIAADECTGPFSKAFHPYVGTGSGQLPMPPEAVITSIRAALDRGWRDLVEPLRVWSFLPLLLGLIGTAVSLRRLLQQQINPTTMPRLTEDMSNALLGTILGVSGALVATVLQRIIARRATQVHGLAEQYLFGVFGRTLPETRVKLQYDDEILEVLKSRAQSIVDEYKLALEPLVKTLETSATAASKAASDAGSTFASVTDAVKDVDKLSAVIDQLTKAAALGAKAGEVLEAQVPLVAQNVALNREAADEVRKTAATVAQSASALEASTVQLTASAESLKVSVEAQRASVERTAAQLETELATLNNQSKAATGHVQDLGREVGALREAVSSFGDTRVQKVADELQLAVRKMLDVLREGLANIPGSVAQEISRLGMWTKETPEHVRQLQSSLEDVQAGLERARETTRELTSEISTVTTARTPAPAPGIPREILEWLNTQLEEQYRVTHQNTRVQQDILAILHDRLPGPKKSRSPSTRWFRPLLWFRRGSA
jgi:methyl-accepting chemotaxis protein